MCNTPRSANVCQATFLALALSLSVPTFAASHAAPRAPAPATNASAPLTIASAINKAGRQRMLSQRMVKAYCQLALKVEPEVSQKILQDSIALFDAQLAELRSISVKPELLQAWTNESEMWTQMRPVVTGRVSAEGAKKLMELSETLLAAAHKLTQQLEVESGKQAGHWVNIAGRQRMLSQRISKFYMLRKLGFSTPESNAALDKAVADFLSAHDALVKGAQNNPNISTELRIAKTHWNFFNIALSNDSGDQIQLLEMVADTSERVLAIMDRVTGMFEQAYTSNP